MRQGVVRELAGVVLLAAGAVAWVAVAIGLGMLGQVAMLVTVIAAPLVAGAGWTMARWDPVAAEERAMARRAAEERARRHAVDPDAVIRER